MANSVLVKASGLHTLKNYYSEIPEGALEKALNVIIDRDSIIEPRRGFFQFGSNTFGISTDRIKQVFSYKNRLLAQYTNKLAFDSTGSGSFSDFSGTYSELSSGLRMKGIEANGNFYFTTSSGIKKISASSASNLSTASGYITNAGGIKSLDIQATLDYSIDSFLSPNKEVAYRVVWGITDNNSNLILGTPSERFVVQNINPNDSAAVKLTFSVPQEVTTTNYFYQIYRTGLFDLGLSGEEFNLVDENFVTTAQITAKIVGASPDEIIDQTPDSFRQTGTLLYTNENSGEGINQANEIPPFAHDITSYKNYTFYGNTKSRQKLELALLSVDDFNNSTALTFDDNTTTRTYTFQGNVEKYITDWSSYTSPLISSNAEAGVSDWVLYCDGMAVDSADAGTDFITIASHGFQNGTALLYTASATAIGGLTHLGTYYVINRTTNTFQLSTVKNGAVINLTTAETGTDFFFPDKPTDGTGVTITPVLTLTEETSNPITETKSYNITRPTSISSRGNWSRGDGAAWNFSINSSFINQLITVSLTYRNTDDYNNDQFRLFIYDVTNAEILDLTTSDYFSLQSSETNITSSFQFVASNSTSYRLILHDASFNQLGFNFIFDDIKVSPDTSDEKYYTLISANNERGYYVWQNSGTATDPLITGKLGIEVDTSRAITINDVVNKNRQAILAATNDFNINKITTVNFTGMTFPGAKAYLDGKYFTILDGSDIRYKIWFDNTGATSEPSVPNTTGVKIDITAVSDTASAIATTVKAKIDTDITSVACTHVAGILTIIPDTFYEINNFPSTNIASGFTINDKKLNIITSNNGYVTLPITQNLSGGFSHTKDGLGLGENTTTQKVFLPRIPAIGENGPLTSQQIDQAARSLIRVINSDSSGLVYGYYLSNSTTTPGLMLFERRTLTDSAVHIKINDDALKTEFNPEVPGIKSGTYTTALGVATCTVTSHGYINGATIAIRNSAPNINGIYTISGVTTHTFQITTSVVGPGTLEVNLVSVISTQEINPNRIYYSKYQQPEAVPLLNYLDIGPKDKAIQRIISLRDSLFIFKEDGIYRLTGDVAPFSFSLFDSSVLLVAPDTATVLNNQIYGVSTQGVISVTDTGVGVVSRPIEDKILDVVRSGYSYATASFAVGYESDRSYLLWTVKEQADTVATQCFRFNTFTNSWTEWDVTATCGLINSEDKICIGAGDQNFIEIERKNKDRTDYTDRQYSLSINDNGVSDNVLNISSTANVAIGDLIQQIQYLTLYQFNQLLNKLDVDPQIAFSGFVSGYSIVNGDNPREVLNLLMAKLALELSNPAYIINTGSTFALVQTDFNSMIAVLNADPNVFYSDYKQSTGTVPYEGNITAVNKLINQVTLTYESPYLEGPITLYKAITSEIIWSPQHMGNPLIQKHIRGAGVFVEDNNFTQAILAFSNNISPGFIEVPFTRDGNGDWGQFNWGNHYWGGVSAAHALNTLIPRPKQRCHFINVKFKHSQAHEKYAIYAMGLIFRAYSEGLINK